MSRSAHESGILAAAVLAWILGRAGVTFGQAERILPPTASAPDRPEITGTSDFDSRQETPAPPATPPPSPDPYPEGPRSSRFLLGDALGLHPVPDERGLSFYVSSTQFEQGVASGGFRQAFRWGGKFDILAHVDTEKVGLWSGGMLDLFTESRLGQSVDGFAGTLSPPNLAMFFPVPDAQITAITGLKFTQEITDRVGIFFGKLNALNGDREKFLKFPLTSRFWNAAFNFNLALDRYPYSAPGAGFYAVPDRGPAMAFLVLDSFNSPRTSGFEKLGQNGAFLYAEVKQTTSFFGLPGRQVLAGLYGTGAFTDLSPASFVELPAGPLAAPKKSGTWTLLWHVEQRLWVDSETPDRGLDLYIQTGLGDGNPNPIRWFLSVALCGNSTLLGREGDILGAGFYNVGLSDEVRTLAPGIRDELGVELFYNLRIRPGFHFGPDVQLIRPGQATVDMAVLFGARLKLDF